MPRRNRRLNGPVGGRGGRAASSLDPSKLGENLAGPSWARVEGFRVLQSVNREKEYICPYCQGRVTRGTPHLVVIPSGRMEDRRHYHTACWAKQAGLRRPT